MASDILGNARRHFTGNVKQDAAEIAAECVRDGVSSSWAFPRDLWGQVDDLMTQLRDHLRHFGIVYVDDMTGQWAPMDRSVRRPSA